MRLLIGGLLAFGLLLVPNARADPAQCLSVLNERLERCAQLAGQQVVSPETQEKLSELQGAVTTAEQELTARETELEEANQRLSAANTPENQQAVVELGRARDATEAGLEAAQAALTDAQAAASEEFASASRAEQEYQQLNCSAFAQPGDEPFAPYDDEDVACDLLATYLEALGTEMAKPSPAVEAEAKEIGDREAQPQRQTANNKSGTVVQIEPVETTKPINLFGGALSVAGTEIGTLGAATISFNPWALGSPDDVVAQRLTDVSVTVPFELGSTSTSNLDFVAIRVRVNITALTSTTELEAALKGYTTAAGEYADGLEEVLKKSSDTAACVAAVERTQKVTSDNCGQDLDRAHLEKMRARSYEALGDARRAADRYYLGLDLRSDLGDPTGDAILGDGGTRLVAGLGAGLRIPIGKRWDWELRCRAAGDYFDSDDENPIDDSAIDPVYAFDWGAAVLLTGSPEIAIDKQRLQFGIGAEGKHSGDVDDDIDELVPTNYVDLNLMAMVPTASGSDLGFKLRIPVRDGAFERETLISVGSDFGVLSKGPGE
jgi:hypothetical protein